MDEGLIPNIEVSINEAMTQNQISVGDIQGLIFFLENMKALLTAVDAVSLDVTITSEDT